MCIIANIPKGVGIINQSTLEIMTNNNSHGFGVSYIDNDEIKVYKSMDNKKFVKRCMEIQQEHSKTSDILIHCRIATSGKTDINNVHPFHVNNETVFAHNGMLDCVEPTDKMSDTRMFNKVLLKNLQPNFLQVKRIREFIGEIIGSDKMVFQTVNPILDKNTYIINEDHGTTENGIWFSNNSYKANKIISNYNYMHDNNSCSIYNESYMLGSEDYLEYVEEFGSISDYITMYSPEESPFDELDDIIEKANSVVGQIVIHTYDNDHANLFTKNKEYKVEKFINNDLLALIENLIEPFNTRFDVDNASTEDLQKVMFDCFGFGLPIIITKVKAKV
jgi:predicted glutamine amidotransferase